MSVTAGAAGKLNTIKGISKIITTSAVEETTLAAKVFSCWVNHQETRR